MKSTLIYLFAIIISVLLHVGLIWGAFTTWDAKPHKTTKTRQYVSASLVQLEDKKKIAAEKKKKQLAKKRKAAVKKKKLAQEKKRKAKIAKEKRLKAEKKKKAAQAKATAQKKKLEAQKKKSAAQAKELAELARMQREKEQKKLREKELALQKQREEAARIEEEQRILADELAAEDEYLQIQEDQIVVASYESYIIGRLVQNWSRPPTARAGMQVILSIQLIPTGEVVAVAIVESSGNAAFDRSAERAVNKVRKFEKIKEMPSRIFERNFRRFSLKFNPEDLKD